MRRVFLCVIALMMVFTTSTSVFAATEGTLAKGEVAVKSIAVVQVYGTLTKAGSTAICKVTVKGKAETNSIYGVFRLVDSSGKTVATDSRYLQKNGTCFVYAHSFNMPKSGTYKVKCTLKAYKNGTLQETITYTTGTVKK